MISVCVHRCLLHAVNRCKQGALPSLRMLFPRQEDTQTETNAHTHTQDHGQTQTHTQGRLLGRTQAERSRAQQAAALEVEQGVATSLGKAPLSP